jgi:hypothetical protein
LEQSRENTPELGFGQLGGVQGDGRSEHAHGDTADKPTNNNHWDGGGAGLKGSPQT